MNLKRTLIIATGCTALAVWLSAAMTPSRMPSAESRATPALAVDASGAALASEIARLRERLRPEAMPRAQARNLFAFQARRRQVDSAPIAAPPPVESPSAPAVPALTLVGLAEDPAPADDVPAGVATTGVVRTAIVSGHGQLFLVKEGETLVDGDTIYTVGTIGVSGVALTDQRDGRALRLALK